METEATTTMENEDNQTTTGQNDDEPQKPWYLKWQTWVKITILLVLLAFLIIAIVFRKTTGEILTSFLNWMTENAAAGSFAFIALYWFCTVTFIPGSLLTLGAGVVFRQVAGPWGGVFLATLVVICGAALGASTAFLLGRFVFREKVASYKAKYEKFDIIDKVIEQQGLKVTILLRLSPIIPFNAFNYFMGLTGVTFRDYNIAHVGMIPGTLAYCFIGGTLGAIGESVSGFDPVVLTVTIVGTVLAVAGMIYISYVAKKEFSKIAEQQKQKEMDADPENGLMPNKDTDGADGDGVDGADTNQTDDTPQYDQQENNDDNNNNDTNNNDNNDNEDEQSLSLGN